MAIPLIKLEAVYGLSEPKDIDLGFYEEMLEQELERLCNRKFRREEIEGEWHTVRFSRVFPKALPIHSVEAVEDATGRELAYLLKDDGLMLETPRDGSEIRLDYTGGYNEKASGLEYDLPAALKQIGGLLVEWYYKTSTNHYSLGPTDLAGGLPGPRSQQKIVQGIPQNLYRRLDPFRRKVPAIGGKYAI